MRISPGSKLFLPPANGGRSLSDHPSERDAILANQERFLESLLIPADVAGRYSELLSRAGATA